MHDTALTIAESCLDEAEIEVFMDMLVIRGDYAFASQMSHLVNSDFLEKICMDLAANDKWADTEGFLPMIETDGIERLMERAISQGDFAAVDLLDDYLIEEDEE
jgi:hypothetical protein